MPLLFDGLKVIDCASFIAGPAAATILSDFGADVIKIEPPGWGDPYRMLSQARGSPNPAQSPNWLLDGRNKRSLALDLSEPRGRDVLNRLVQSADVFITNFPFPVRDRLGIGYDSLAALNSRLIYASFTGYGEYGAERDKLAFDSTAWWARSGLMDTVRGSSQHDPARSVPGMGDHPSAVALFAAIVTALYQRERIGTGDYVGSSLIANGAWSNGCLIQAKLCGTEPAVQAPRDRAANPLANHYRCGDGRWLCLALLNPDRQWPILVAAIGQEHLAADPRFATTRARHANARELIAILDQAFTERTVSEWRALLDDRGLPFGVVATLDDISTDAQMLANDVLVQLVDEPAKTINSPFFLRGAAKAPPRRAPKLGEHSEQILRETGLDSQGIQLLKQSGIVA
jgi:crotonobetainyl-CoA:carnitine CoA-transferase CaiB-like acyl-CoA transferase